MQLPPEIVIGPYVYRIELRADLSDGTHAADGLCLPALGEIVLNRHNARRMQQVALLHEVLHAVLDMTGADGRSEKEQQAEERLVRHLDAMLLDTLQRNPMLVEFLLADWSDED